MQTPERQQGKQAHSLLRVSHPEGRWWKPQAWRCSRRRARETAEGPPGPHWALPVGCYLKGADPQPISPVESSVMSPSSSPEGEDWGLRWETWEGWATGRAGNRHSLQVSGKHKSQDTVALQTLPWQTEPRQPQRHLRTLFSRQRGLLLRDPKGHRRSVGSERRIRWPGAETPRRGLRSTQERECLRQEPVAWGGREKKSSQEVLREIMEWLPEWGGTTCWIPRENNKVVGVGGAAGASTNQLGNRKRPYPSPSHYLMQWEDRKGIYSNA